MLEDTATDVVLINHELRRAGLQFQTKRVETKKDFLRELEHNAPDAILSDHGLPAFDGFAALAIARDKAPDTPFIFVTNARGEALAIDSLRSGATDYVLKERLDDLAPALERALRLAAEKRARREAEDKLRESEERFRLLVGGVKECAVFMLDAEGKVSSWNAGAELIHGFTADEVLHRHFACLYLPDDRKAGKPEADLAAAARDTQAPTESWRVRKNGGQFWAQTTITALRDSSGQLRGYTHLTRDVTERRQSQESLRISEDRYRSLVELCPDALLVLIQGRITFINSAAQALFGARENGEVIGRDAESFVAEADRPAFQQRLRQLNETGPPSTAVEPPSFPPGFRPTAFVETRLIRPDGKEIEAEIAAARLVFQDQPAIQLIAHDITERKQAEAALAESEGRKAAILETSLDAILCVDQKGKIREWNPAAERIFGYARAEAIDQPMDKLVVPSSLRERYLPGLADYLATGVGSLIGRPIELTARRSNNEEFPIELAITRSSPGQAPLFTVFVRDITERKKVEEGLRQSEARKTAVVESSLDAIVSVDHEGKIIEWNLTAAKIFGYSLPLALGRDLADLILPRSAAGTERLEFIRLLRANRGRLIGRRTEMMAIRANGAQFPIELAITRLSGNGAPTFTSFIRDITERRRMEEALRTSEERFRLLVDTVEDYAIYMLDARGRVVTWNSGAERIEGCKAQDVVRRKFSLFYTPDEAAQGKPDEALAVARAEGRFQDDRWRIRPDGSRYWANVVITALRDPQKQPYGFSVIVRDMTKRKEAEDEARRMYSELEQRVQDRTAELQTAYDEMESYSYSISHDLRAPLIHIAGFVDILQQEAGPRLDDKSRHYLKTVAESARHMGRMIDGLLSFSRMSRAEMHKVRVDLSELVKGVIRDLRGETGDRKVDWTVGALPQVRGDPSMLRQAIFNLLANALKYTQNREVAKIEVGALSAKEESIVYFRDNGVGFDPKYAGKLFGVFQRLHTAADFDGTGIGLANVRRIIQRHGGRAWAEGKLDAGATFFISFPEGGEANHDPDQIRTAGGR